MLARREDVQDAGNIPDPPGDRHVGVDGCGTRPARDSFDRDGDVTADGMVAATTDSLTTSATRELTVSMAD
jgi:hypothetical protein